MHLVQTKTRSGRLATRLQPETTPTSRTATTTKTKQRLRPVSFRNYVESPIVSPIVPEPTNKLPVYMAKVLDQQNSDDKDDLYDFDSDTEQIGHGAIKKKTRRKRRPKTIRKLPKQFYSTRNKYDTAINTILKNVMKKVNEKREPIETVEPVMTVVDEDDQYFGFNDDNNVVVNVVDDVCVTPEADNLPVIPKRTVLTPWRFNDINIKRNPHFLQLKKSALPSMDQDMVLDHTICENLNQSAVVVSMEKRRKSPRQSSIRDFLITNDDDSNKENTVKRTGGGNDVAIFDDHQFSPIKKRLQVLTPKDDNIRLEGPSSSSSTATEKIPFFDLSTEEDIDRSPVVGRPFRANLKPRAIFNSEEKIVENQQEQEQEEEGDSVEVDKSIEDEVPTKIIGLFEDIEPSSSEMPKKKYERRQKRQKWMMAPEETAICEEKLMNKRKKKNQRTKSEEREAEEWAKAFNAMCEEVDQFPLEIE